MEQIINSLMSDEVRAHAFDVIAGISALAWLARAGANAAGKYAARTSWEGDDKVAGALDAFASGLEWLSNKLGSLPILPRKR